MAKDREIKCLHYLCEGSCDLGHKGTFRHACQTCKQYNPVRGSMPARKDNRRQKLERAQCHDRDY